MNRRRLGDFPEQHSDFNIYQQPYAPPGSFPSQPQTLPPPPQPQRQPNRTIPLVGTPNPSPGRNVLNILSQLFLWLLLIGLGVVILLLALGIIGAKEKLCHECLESLNNSTLDLSNFTLNLSNSTINLFNDSTFNVTSSNVYYTNTTILGDDIDLNITDSTVNIYNSNIYTNQSSLYFFQDFFQFEDTVLEYLDTEILYKNVYLEYWMTFSFWNNSILYFLQSYLFLENSKLEIESVYSTDICGTGGLNVSTLSGCDGNPLIVNSPVIFNKNVTYNDIVDNTQPVTFINNVFFEDTVVMKSGLNVCPTNSSFPFKTDYIEPCSGGTLTIDADINVSGFVTSASGLRACPAPTLTRVDQIGNCINNDPVTFVDPIIMAGANAINTQNLHVKNFLSLPLDTRISEVVTRLYHNGNLWGGVSIATISTAGTTTPGFFTNTLFNDSFIDSSLIVNAFGPFVSTTSRNSLVRIMIQMDDTGSAAQFCGGEIRVLLGGGIRRQAQSTWWSGVGAMLNVEYLTDFLTPGSIISWQASLIPIPGCPTSLGILSMSVEILTV